MNNLNDVSEQADQPDDYDPYGGYTDKQMKKNIKTQKWPVENAQIETNDECSICIEKFTEGKDVWVLKCGHVHHKFCLRNWLLGQRRCPLCNTKPF